jgi:hypothetical protein
VTIDPHARRRAELEHERESLRTEWRYWQGQVSQPVMEKHKTQVESVVGMLGASLAELADDSSAEVSERVLDLHHVWDFFRYKFALRYVEPLRAFLDVADELAWAVYGPAARAAGKRGRELREPPLVFLDRNAVPFASIRGGSYRDLLPRAVRTKAGADAARILPFPVIGVPWYLTGHLPGVLLVAHEAGHHIEDDCAMTAALCTRLAAAGLPESRSRAWERWLGEVFADVVASVACGVAYPAVLIDALAAAPAGGAGAEHYPPPRIRARVCLAAIAQADLPGDDELAASGDTLGSPVQADDEAGAVVRAILSGPYDELDGADLPALLNCKDVGGAGNGAERLLTGRTSKQPTIPAVLAAAALAFARSPADYDHYHVASYATDEVLRLRPAGVRGSADPLARKARDESAGRALLAGLTGA